jgi:UDP-glucose 4-epimerase
MRPKKKVALVTGAAGFIGSNFVDFLLKKKYKVFGLDNFSTGKKNFLNTALKNKNFKFYKIDLLKLKSNSKLFNQNIDIVFHFAANADVRYGFSNPKKDIKQNIVVTSNIMEAIKYNNIKKIVFTSTGSVYGETKNIPTAESEDFPIQTSLYASSKIACEGMISSYCKAFNIQSWIFRFVSVLGERYTHGHVYDFYKKLVYDKDNLVVLGNGNQRKSYIYVGDCIRAVMKSINFYKKQINIINLGHHEYISIRQSIKYISQYLSVSPKLKFTSKKSSGWHGDNSFIHLDIKKLKKTGWKPKLSIKDGIIKTLKYINENKWLLNLENKKKLKFL